MTDENASIWDHFNPIGEMPDGTIVGNFSKTHEPLPAGTNLEELRAPGIYKYGATLHLSEEQQFNAAGLMDPRYPRRAKVTYTPAAPEAWDRYRAAVAGLAALEAYEGTMFGGPDYGTEVPEPGPIASIEYLETVDEWLTRCRAMKQQDEQDARESRRLDPNP